MKKVQIILIAFFCLVLVACSSGLQSVSALNKVQTTKNNNLSSDEELERGLFVSLSIALNGGNGSVWATGKNHFELFSSTVYVIVMLYSSTTYCDNYADMTLISSVQSIDLATGNTVVAEALTNGEQKYWLGRMRYKIDNRSWAEKDTGVLLYSAQGEFVGV